MRDARASAAGSAAVDRAPGRLRNFVAGLSGVWLIVLATLLFAAMGVCVKLAAAHYASGEIVFYRGLIGALLMATLARVRGGTLVTHVPAMHFWRSVSGVVSLSMWFYAISNLPLATAMTLNYMSSIWMALFIVCGAVLFGTARVDGRLVVAVLVGFCGVVLVLRPTIEERQLGNGMVGLLSGVVAATAYLQISALGRAGEPEFRTVFYFSAGSVVAGALSFPWTGLHAHTAAGAGLLLLVGVLASAAQLLMTRAYSTGRTLVNASLQYLGIVYAFIFGVLIFDDKVSVLAVVGTVLIVLAGLLATMLQSPRAQVASAESVTS